MKELKFLNICYDKNNFDKDFIDYISSYTNNFLKYEHQSELIELINTKDIHFVITKYDFEFLKEIRTLNKQIQIIAVFDEFNHSHLLECLELKYIKFIRNIECVNIFIDVLKDCVKNLDSNKSNIMDIGNNFIYDKYNKILIKDNNIISLTNKELLLLNFLLKNHNCSLSYEEINTNIWSGVMTQDSLRSLVKELRKKTFKELIKNVSGIGYRIDIQI